MTSVTPDINSKESCYIELTTKYSDLNQNMPFFKNLTNFQGLILTWTLIFLCGKNCYKKRNQSCAMLSSKIVKKLILAKSRKLNFQFCKFYVIKNGTNLNFTQYSGNEIVNFMQFSHFNISMNLKLLKLIKISVLKSKFPA